MAKAKNANVTNVWLISAAVKALDATNTPTQYYKAMLKIVRPISLDWILWVLGMNRFTKHTHSSFFNGFAVGWVRMASISNIF